MASITASVRARLANRAQRDNHPFQQVLQYYGLERFLYRFSQLEQRNEFILKGALMLRVWNAPITRPTRDIDLLAFSENSVTHLEAIMRDACEVIVPDDGLRFDPLSVSGSRIKEDSEYEGVRVRFGGFLDKARIPMQIDVGFGVHEFGINGLPLSGAPLWRKPLCPWTRSGPNSNDSSFPPRKLPPTGPDSI